MLHEYALNYIELGSDIEKTRVLFARAFETDGTISDADRRDVRIMLSDLAKVCESLNLPVAARTVRHAENFLPQTRRELEILLFSVYAELESRQLLFIPVHLSPYYEWEEVVSEAVINAFPSASDEIREAASCYALGRFTAAVFHAMRAAEIGIRALAEAVQPKLKHPIELADWQILQTAVQDKIGEVGRTPRSTERDTDLEFFSQAGAQLQFFKDGWRVRVMHSRSTYNESRSKEAIDHVRAFFETISSRFEEPL